MAVDQTLITGAASANIARKPVAAKAITGITKSVSEGTLNIAQGFAQRDAKLNELKAQIIADENLSQEDQAVMQEYFEQGRKDYVTGGPKERSQAMMDIAKKQSELKRVKDFKLKVADEYDKGNITLSPNDPNSEEVQLFLEATMGPIKTKDGNVGYEIKDPNTGEASFKTVSQVEDMLKSRTKDNTFKDGLAALAESQLSAGKKLPLGQNQNFDDFTAKAQVSSLIESSPNMSSLVHDKMFGQTSFYDDVTEYLSSDEITSIVSESSGVDVSDGISDEEKKIIMDELLKPENSDMLKNELSQYYIDHLKNNYEAGKSSRATTDPNYVTTETVTTQKYDKDGNLTAESTDVKSSKKANRIVFE